MKARVFLILSLAVLMGTPNTSAQSFKEKFKKVTEKVGQQVKQEVKNSGKKSDNTSNRNKETPKRQGNQHAKDKTSTVNLPETHTAFFAPLGEPVDAKYGIKSMKPVRPPKEETKQPDWNDARTHVYELDNQSLADEFQMLDDCINSGYIDATGPASFRYHNVKDELVNRADALNKMVNLYNEAKDEYDSDEQGFIDLNNNRLAAHLKGRLYQTVIRSSIAPFFTLKGNWISNEAKTYFKAHGGYENAHKANWTVWNP
jgi:hypothetical protein